MVQKYCGKSDVTCAGMKRGVREGVDYGRINHFSCFIGTKCEEDLCNRFVPGRREVAAMKEWNIQWWQTLASEELQLSSGAVLRGGQRALVVVVMVALLANVLSTQGW